jgi:hypothetical protein
LVVIEDRIMEVRQIIDGASFGPAAPNIVGQNPRIELTRARLSVASDNGGVAAVLKRPPCRA